MQSQRLVLTRLWSREFLLGQFLRYLVVGAIATVVDFAVLVLLKEVAALYYLVSASIAFCGGLAVNYALSVVWVFGARTLTNKKTEFLVFAAVGLVGLGWIDLLMYLGTDVVGLDYRLSKVITVVLVLFWNFSMRKVMLFRSIAESCDKDDPQDRDYDTVGSRAGLSPPRKNEP